MDVQVTFIMSVLVFSASGGTVASSSVKHESQVIH